MRGGGRCNDDVADRRPHVCRQRETGADWPAGRDGPAHHWAGSVEGPLATTRAPMRVPACPSLPLGLRFGARPRFAFGGFGSGAHAAPGADEQDGGGGQDVIGDARYDENRADLPGRREMWTAVG